MTTPPASPTPATPADAASQDPARPPVAFKALGLGFMKTGLTSMLVAMRRMGLRAEGRRRRVFMAFVRGDFDAVMAHYDHADAFADWPHPYMYRPFLKKYGERARFILTVRDADEWYQSLLRHNRFAHPITHTQKYIFGRYYPHGFEQEHKDIYTRHNDAVRQFIQDEGIEDQYLELEIGAADGVQRLTRFLGVTAAFDSYPRENVSAARPIRDALDTFRGAYNRLALPAYERFAPQLAPRHGPYFNAVTADLRHQITPAGG